MSKRLTTLMSVLSQGPYSCPTDDNSSNIRSQMSYFNRCDKKNKHRKNRK